MAYAISGTAQLLQLDSAEPTLPSGLSAEPVSELPGVPVTRARPAPHNLHKQGLVKPEVTRACAVADVMHPHGHALTPSNRTTLQQHFDYFDMNKDGIITLWETFQSFRYLHLAPEPINTLVCLAVTLPVHAPLAYLTQDSWIPDPRMLVHTRNAHKVVHGSNTKAWDHEGRWRPTRFEALLSKYDRDNKGGLNHWDLIKMIYGQSNMGDILGLVASSAEWFATWWILADDKGVIKREDLRGMYDGTAFYRRAAACGHNEYSLSGPEGRQMGLGKGRS